MARSLASALAFLIWAGSQDRADLQLPIETWYKVVQGGRPVGYAHEVLKRADSPRRYDYRLEAEFEPIFRGKARDEDFAAAALLDDTLDPVAIFCDGNSAESSWSMEVVASEADRSIQVRAPGAADPVAWTLPSQEGLFVLPTLALYQLRQNESLSRPGRLTKRVLDFKGQEKDGLRVEIEVGAAARRRYLDKEVTVIPITFLRPFPAATPEAELREAFVDRYGRILEATMAGGLKIVIVGDRSQALEGTGGVRRQGRRDPFDRSSGLRTLALERTLAGRGDILPPKPAVRLDTLDGDMATALKLIEEARAHRSAGELEEARRSYLGALVHLKAIRELAEPRRPNLLPAIDRAREEAEAAWDGAAQVEREARERFVGIVGLANRLDIEGLERTRRELDLLGDRLEVERRPERERIGGWAAEAGAVVVKCRTRLELARARLVVSGITIGERADEESLDSRISLFGVILGPVQKITLVRPFAMADVNGRLVRRGDTIEGTGIRVDDISPQGVRFSLREEVRDVGLRH